MDSVEVAATLVAARKGLGMSQGHLAHAAGVSRSTVQRAERGVPVSAENARSLCAVLGLDLAGPMTQQVPPVPPREASEGRPAPLLGNGRMQVLGPLWVATVLALGSVFLFGPYIQRSLAGMGFASPGVQAWAETLLPLLLSAVVVALPPVLLHDERRAGTGRRPAMPASNLLATLVLTGSGVILFLAVIVPILLVV